MWVFAVRGLGGTRRRKCGIVERRRGREGGREGERLLSGSVFSALRGVIVENCGCE